MFGANGYLTPIDASNEAALGGSPHGVDEIFEARGLVEEGSFELSPCFLTFACDGADLFVTCSVQECVVDVQDRSLIYPRLAAAAYCYADQTISSPSSGGAVRFEPLGSTLL